MAKKKTATVVLTATMRRNGQDIPPGSRLNFAEEEAHRLVRLGFARWPLQGDLPEPATTQPDKAPNATQSAPPDAAPAPTGDASGSTA